MVTVDSDSSVQPLPDLLSTRVPDRLSDDALPLLPTSVVGSHATPAWFIAGMAEVKRGEFGPVEQEELYADAIDLAILDQERAGVDVVTDGEMRRQGFVVSFYPRFTGLERVPAERRKGPAGYDQMPGYRAVDVITAPNGLGIVTEYRFARPRTRRPFKITCPGPLTLTLSVRPGPRYKDVYALAAAFVPVVNAELRALVAAGANFIQIDEPLFGTDPGEPARLVELLERAVEGVNAKLALHICFGNMRGRPLGKRSYAPLFPAFRDVPVDQLVFEYANRELAELERWSDWGGDRELGAGLIDVKSWYVETPEDVAVGIRAALKYVPAEKLWIVPDCGFSASARHITVAKLQAMVAGARLVRQELAGAPNPQK